MVLLLVSRPVVRLNITCYIGEDPFLFVSLDTFMQDKKRPESAMHDFGYDLKRPEMSKPYICCVWVNFDLLKTCWVSGSCIHKESYIVI